MRGSLWIPGLALAAAAALALDPPRPVPPAAPPAAKQEQEQKQEQQGQTGAVPVEEAPPVAQVPPVAAPEEEERLPPLPSGTRPTGPTPQRFDPTEKVRADFPVSFPIDI